MPDWKPLERVGSLAPGLNRDGTQANMTVRLSGRADQQWCDFFEETAVDSVLTRQAHTNDYALITVITVTFGPDGIDSVVPEIDERIQRANALYEQKFLPERRAAEAAKRSAEEKHQAAEEALQARARKFNRPDQPPVI
jgi:hypothetical protein